MEPEEALVLFSKRFDNWQDLEEEEKGVVERILDSMDHLPLAVVGSAAFMAENGTSPSTYWSIFQKNDKRTKELLSEQFCDIQREVDMTESILGTYFITFDRITEQMPLMEKLLGLIAFLDRQNIPEELLTHSGVEGMDDSLKFCQAIGKLLRFSLVTEVKLEGATLYELHRLVQLSIQTYLSMEQASQGRATGLRTVSRLFPEYEYKRRSVCAAYMSHALVLTKDSTDTTAEDLVYRMGRHYFQMGSYNNAEIQARQCIVLREAGKMRDLEGVNSRVALLGAARLYQGRFKEAEVIFRKVLKDVENNSGLDHPNTSWVVNSLAVALREQARYEESEVLNRRAMEGYEKCFGFNHSNTLMASQNLARVLLVRGRYEESEVMNRRTLEGYEKCFGSNHPNTLLASQDLAQVLLVRGRCDESEAMGRRALEVFEKCLGSDHPDTLRAVDNLALVLREQGRYDESE
ncbi:unnamed protein product [Tuber aestivum]|uniref:DUF7779 domain-containing protein n=1 Tax=Tuber aestivum TaxID=59557 RepID=A0A292Q433_9PEZI|nr:unnamed protein product [Tuber aestivum]